MDQPMSIAAIKAEILRTGDLNVKVPGRTITTGYRRVAIRALINEGNLIAVRDGRYTNAPFAITSVTFA